MSVYFINYISYITGTLSLSVFVSLDVNINYFFMFISVANLEKKKTWLEWVISFLNRNQHPMCNILL